MCVIIKLDQRLERKKKKKRALIGAWRSFYINNPHTRAASLVNCFAIETFFFLFNISQWSFISCCDDFFPKHKKYCLLERFKSEIKASQSVDLGKSRRHCSLGLCWLFNVWLRHRAIWHISFSAPLAHLLQNPVHLSLKYAPPFSFSCVQISCEQCTAKHVAGIMHQHNTLSNYRVLTDKLLKKGFGRAK